MISFDHEQLTFAKKYETIVIMFKDIKCIQFDNKTQPFNNMKDNLMKMIDDNIGFTITIIDDKIDNYISCIYDYECKYYLDYIINENSGKIINIDTIKEFLGKLCLGYDAFLFYH